MFSSLCSWPSNGKDEAAWLKAELSASLNARSAFAGAPVKICVKERVTTKLGGKKGIINGIECSDRFWVPFLHSLL